MPKNPKLKPPKKIKYKLVDKITSTYGVDSSPGYKAAHAKASRDEKKLFPKGYKELKKVEEKMPAHQYLGQNTLKGKIKISKLTPKKNRKEVAFHELDELTKRQQLSRTKKKK
jgi:hypothetical protein